MDILKVCQLSLAHLAAHYSTVHILYFPLSVPYCASPPSPGIHCNTLILAIYDIVCALHKYITENFNDAYIFTFSINAYTLEFLFLHENKTLTHNLTSLQGKQSESVGKGSCYTNLVAWVQSLEFTQNWEERTAFLELSSDLHTCVMLHGTIHNTHAHTYPSYICTRNF